MENKGRKMVLVCNNCWHIQSGWSCRDGDVCQECKGSTNPIGWWDECMPKLKEQLEVFYKTNFKNYYLNKQEHGGVNMQTIKVTMSRLPETVLESLGNYIDNLNDENSLDPDQMNTIQSLINGYGAAWDTLEEVKTISQLTQEAHDNAVLKGWWIEDRSFGELIALMHSELSEALEDFSNGEFPITAWYEKNVNGDLKTETNQLDDTWKPCGIPSELADVVIRIFDACGRYNIDLEQAISEKMAFNATRPQRHGGKKI